MEAHASQDAENKYVREAKGVLLDPRCSLRDFSSRLGSRFRSSRLLGARLFVAALLRDSSSRLCCATPRGFVARLLVAAFFAACLRGFALGGFALGGFARIILPLKPMT